MCRMFSGITTKTGDHYFIPEFTDSHEVIARAHNLRDTEEAYYSGTLVRWEFTPPEDLTKLEDGAAWDLRVDEKQTPEWWDAEAVHAFAWRQVSQMFVCEMRGTLLGGCWIFLPGGGCKELLAGRIVIAREGADIARANLTGADLARANLTGANLARANLTGANLARADLTGANLARADLTWADLTGANLARANLTGANLTGANLARADLTGWIVDTATGICTRQT